jgi:hypothetical protein
MRPEVRTAEAMRYPSGLFSGPIGMMMVYPEYFATAGIPLSAGREFTNQDLTEGSPRVCLVNEAFVRKFYAGENPIGRPCTSANFEIVGVVKDSRYMNPTGQIPPLIYQTFLQAATGRGEMTLYVRTAGKPDPLLPRIREEVWNVDEAVPQFEIHTLAQEMDIALTRERLIATLSTLFGALALLLACVGLYGLLAFGVVQRSKEIGVRMALGANRTGIVWTVMRDAWQLLGIGIAVGAPAVLGIERFASSRWGALLFASPIPDPTKIALGTQSSGLLFGIKPTDPAAILSAAALLLLIAGIAAYLPARRASMTDPMVTLRNE